MYDLADFAMQMSPEERAMMTANLLRRRQSSDALQQANAQANRFNNMAAITQMANNKPAADAAATAQRNAQAQFKPVQMGNQGFALPSSGEFVSSPLYEDEQNAARTARRDALTSQIQSRADMARMLEQGRNDRANDQNTLRALIALLGSQDRNRAIDVRESTGGPAGPKPKGLAGSDVRELTKRESVASSFGELVNSFKPQYAGTTFLATAENALGRYQPFGMGQRYADQANWWQNYNNAKNDIRHALFGSALTVAEQAAFDRANITEGMSPDEINRRLRQQHRATVQAYNKLKATYARGGYDMSQFNDLAAPEDVAQPGGQPGTAGRGPNPIQPGVTLPRAIPPRQPQQAPAPAGLNLPPGFKLIGPAP